jgi:hypothetical protein
MPPTTPRSARPTAEEAAKLATRSRVPGEWRPAFLIEGGAEEPELIALASHAQIDYEEGDQDGRAATWAGPSLPTLLSRQGPGRGPRTLRRFHCYHCFLYRASYITPADSLGLANHGSVSAVYGRAVDHDRAAASRRCHEFGGGYSFQLPFQISAAARRYGVLPRSWPEGFPRGAAAGRVPWNRHILDIIRAAAGPAGLNLVSADNRPPL